MNEGNKYVIPFTFLRTKDPRPEYVEHVQQYREQVRLRDKYNVPFTCLMTYDAMRDEEMSSLVKADMNDKTDVGIWLELCREVVEKAGIKWRGKGEWEWTVEPGFLMAYTKDEKERIIDCVMAEYHKLFGCYPRTIAAWLIDSDSMQYMTEKYSPDAFAICREQWAMDAYTLWGGPYYGAYYPSKNNMLCPAQTKEQQINTPVFRIYVNDQIYCYYEHESLRYNDIDYHLFTQEPTWMCGQNSEWIKWHYDNMFKNNSSGFLYTQIGQENSFQWTKELDRAIKAQYILAESKKAEYGFEYMTFAEMGRLFKEKYTQTPDTCIYALDDWANKGNKSVWFNNGRYRINVFSDRNRTWIRDLQLFDENHRDVYLDEPCSVDLGVYDNLPIVDGVQFSDNITQGGMFFGNGSIKSIGKCGDNTFLKFEINEKEIILRFLQNEIVMESAMDFEAEFCFKQDCEFIEEISEKKIRYKHKSGTEYSLVVKEGIIKENSIYSQIGRVVLEFDTVGIAETV